MFEVLGSTWAAAPFVYFVWRAARAMKAARKNGAEL
jgi:hypothetical protein